MRVLHLEAGTHLYGGALQVLLLVEGLRQRGIETVLVAPRGSAVEAEARRRALPLLPVPVAGEADPRFLLRFRRLVRDWAPDVVHLHSRRGADTLGAVAARWAGAKLVMTRRVDNPDPRWLVGLKYPLFHRVIAISEAIRDLLVRQGVDPAKIRRISSALDPGPFQGPCEKEAFRRDFGLSPGDVVVGMAAQFIPRKGHEVLLHAIPHILKQHPAARFLLFGQGPLRESISGKVEAAHLQDSVLLPGFRNDLPRILPCLDLLVHPASMEGMGVILLQAGAAGIPVVATAVGGIPEVVVHGQTGLLVPPGDPLRLASAVASLLSDTQGRLSMGEAARERVRSEFSVDRMVEGNLSVYEELLSDAT